ncbi:TPA: EscS/YscS/HrcS family type III secretion system export apparatus protein [bacterium]|nr:EscS/YscS/HrcS family type III secretion system export apparatus protein [bacterium]
MTEGLAIHVFREVVFYAIILALPMLGISIIVGLIISIIQTATSIQEQTITFVPKILAVLITAGLCAVWIGRVIGGWTIRLFDTIPTIVR